tara:strand:+ start:450 stop:908 length:459 start_codon:yes stop_codon:yes gene_type:complete
MPENKKKGLLAKLKAKNRKNKLAKAGLKESDLYNKKTAGSSKFKKEANTEVFKNGGKTKKAKRAGKKVIRKIKRGKDVQTQSAKDIMAKVVGRTQDPVKGGSGTIKKTTTAQKISGKTQSVLSTRAKGKLSSVNKAVKKELGYSKGGFIQYD